jgi:preprotein translocase subunit SecE
MAREPVRPARQPSLPGFVVLAQKDMQQYIWIIVWAVIIGGAFVWLWRAGHLARFAAYVQQTREELRKCTWPSWDELKGSTVVVSISILILGAFTIFVDFVFSVVVRWIT